MTESVLQRFLGGRRKAGIPGGREVQILSARELLQAGQEGKELAAEKDAEGLCVNAAILARAIRENGRAVFADGAEVLSAMSAEEIARDMERYVALCEQEDGPCSDEAQAALMEALGADDWERLKWKVLKAFSVLPSSVQAKQMTRGDYLYCAMQMRLDEQAYLDGLCPQCREAAEENRCPCCGARIAEENPQFDAGRFEELKDG